MSAILEHLDEVLYVLRFPEGDFLRAAVQFVTGRAQAITGCETKEFIKDPGLWLSLLHPDDLPALKEATRRIVESQRPGTREYRLRNRMTGAYRSIEDRVAPLLDADGRLVGMVGAARDITEAKRTAQALEQLWRRLLTEGSLRGEYVARQKDGSIRNVEYRVAANILPGLHVSVGRDAASHRFAGHRGRRRARPRAASERAG